MARGIAGRDLFSDDDDRSMFLHRSGAIIRAYPLGAACDAGERGNGKEKGSNYTLNRCLRPRMRGCTVSPQSPLIQISVLINSQDPGIAPGIPGADITFVRRMAD